MRLAANDQFLDQVMKSQAVRRQTDFQEFRVVIHQIPTTRRRALIEFDPTLAVRCRDDYPVSLTIQSVRKASFLRAELSIFTLTT
jgi:hypothetical protein